MIQINQVPRFQPGRVTATPRSLMAIRTAGAQIWELLARHIVGDWGVVDSVDKRANEDALLDGSRLLSVYLLGDSTKVWIITEAVDDSGSRPFTSILLPDEY